MPGIASFLGWNIKPDPARLPIRVSIALPDGDLARRNSMALSPNGRDIVYVAFQDGERRLYRREIGRFEAVPIPGSEGARSPFFSPNGNWVGFFVFPVHYSVPPYV